MMQNAPWRLMRTRMSDLNSPQTYKEITAEIDKLKRLAEEVRRKEVQAVIAKMNEQILLYGLTPADLKFPTEPVDARSEKPAAPATPRVPKATGSIFPKGKEPLGPDGKLWKRVGRKPTWYRAAEAAWLAKMAADKLAE